MWSFYLSKNINYGNLIMGNHKRERYYGDIHQSSVKNEIRLRFPLRKRKI